MSQKLGCPSFLSLFSICVSGQLVACALSSPSLWLCGELSFLKALRNIGKTGHARVQIPFSQVVKAGETPPPPPAVSGELQGIRTLKRHFSGFVFRDSKEKNVLVSASRIRYKGLGI